MNILEQFAVKLNASEVGVNKIDADQDTLAGALGTVYLIAGIVAVLVIVIAGYIFTTSRGDSNQVTRARNAIIAAAVGLAFIFSAFIVTQFVLGRIG